MEEAKVESLCMRAGSKQPVRLSIVGCWHAASRTPGKARWRSGLFGTEPKYNFQRAVPQSPWVVAPEP